MNTQPARKPVTAKANEPDEIARFFGEILSFNNSLKLMHWDITGKGSYATHISLDEAITDLWDATDRMIETTYASLGNLHIIIPETIKPNDHLSCVSLFYDHIETKRGLFAELFTQSIIDDYQEAIKQLLYRLKRLS